jgi:opacity protein-like surface antigen
MTSSTDKAAALALELDAIEELERIVAPGVATSPGPLPGSINKTNRTPFEGEQMTRSHKPRQFLSLACATLVSVLMFAAHASAQEPARIQVYGGYSILHPNLPDFDSDPAVSKTAQSLLGNLSGWNAGVMVGLTRDIGIAADVSRYYKNFNTTLDGSDFDAKLRANTFLFGPQFTKNGERLRPFARALFGAAHGSAKATVDGLSGEDSRTVFAASLGGGLDMKVNDRVAIRTAQIDYYPFRSSQGGGLTFDNFRFGVGIVFYLR